MISIGRSLTLVSLATSFGIHSGAASSASLGIAFASGANGPAPIVRITLQNLSVRPLRVTCAGAFFDYEIQLTDSKGHQVQLTKEARDIRSGRGAVVMSATVVTLNQNEVQQEDVDIARYFNLSGGGAYTLILSRVLDG